MDGETTKGSSYQSNEPSGHCERDDVDDRARVDGEEAPVERQYRVLDRYDGHYVQNLRNVDISKEVDDLARVGDSVDVEPERLPHAWSHGQLGTPSALDSPSASNNSPTMQT